MATRNQPETEAPLPAAWSIESARALYNVEGWGAGYFDSNERGRVIVRPNPEQPHLTADLRDLAHDLEDLVPQERVVLPRDPPRLVHLLLHTHLLLLLVLILLLLILFFLVFLFVLRLATFFLAFFFVFFFFFFFLIILYFLLVFLLSAIADSSTC